MFHNLHNTITQLLNDPDANTDKLLEVASFLYAAIDGAKLQAASATLRVQTRLQIR